MKMNLTCFLFSHVHLNDDYIRVVAWGLDDVDDNVEKCSLQKQRCRRRHWPGAQTCMSVPNAGSSPCTDPET